MKYCVLIIDGASGWPLPERGGKTCLELAHTPNMDRMAGESVLGLVRTVPPGMEPSSACACMAVLGYDPKLYYRGRSAIEARSIGIPINEGEVVFRCNLVAVSDGNMWDYSSGHITSNEGHALITALEEGLGNDKIHFYPGVGYRHICKIKGAADTLLATCTPPHDIPGEPIAGFLPHGPGSELLRELMLRSEDVLREHPVNIERKSRGDIPATMIWLFWGSSQIPELPPFKELYGLDAAMTSGVDLLRGLAKMAGIEALDLFYWLGTAVCLTMQTLPVQHSGYTANLRITSSFIRVCILLPDAHELGGGRYLRFSGKVRVALDNRRIPFW